MTTSTDLFPGEAVLVNWLGEGWFAATVHSLLPGTQSCMVQWVDGNWCAEEAKFADLLRYREPGYNDIVVGSRVLFRQGIYRCQGVVSDRWHHGVITEVIGNMKAEPLYDGDHMGDDGYDDYSPTFTNMKLSELRLPLPIQPSAAIPSAPPVRQQSPDPVMPEVGSQVFVAWYGYGWFTAIIERYIDNQESCMVRWTDGNWSAESASYKNLIADRAPDPKILSIGSRVLFPQGLYYCTPGSPNGTGRSLSAAQKEIVKRRKEVSVRWHVGVITDVVNGPADGDVSYSGKHVSREDPGFQTDNFDGHSDTFEGLKLEDLRDTCLLSDYKRAERQKQDMDNMLTQICGLLNEND